MVSLSKSPKFTFLILAIPVCLLAQSSLDSVGRLPTPTGPYGIGRLTLLCEDPSRLEPLAPTPTPRRIMVDVWYPTEKSTLKNATPAKYLDVETFEHAMGAADLRKQLGDSYDAIKSGRVVTHSIAQAPFATSIRLAPVLLFSPGGGMIRELYSSQMEELASHGYIVAAMNHTYDGFLTVFPDGSSIAYNGKRWPRIPSVEGEANLNQLEWHTADILAVLDHLTRLNRETPSEFPIAGHIDLSRVGAFGHSFGGVAAAHACQKDQRIKACLNQDGSMSMKPFYLDVHNWGMDQAFMLIERPPNREPLTDNDLATLKMTRAMAMELIARLNADRNRAMKSTGMGSDRVLLRSAVTTHMDFSDLQILSSKNESELDHRLQVLSHVTSFTLAFFDQYVRDRKTPLLERNTPDQILESVEKFPPAPHQH